MFKKALSLSCRRRVAGGSFLAVSRAHLAAAPPRHCRPVLALRRLAASSDAHRAKAKVARKRKSSGSGSSSAAVDGDAQSQHFTDGDGVTRVGKNDEKAMRILS